MYIVFRIDDAEGRHGVLLTRYHTLTTECSFRRNEKVDELGLSYIYERRAGHLTIDVIFRRVDLATKEFKVYKIRRGLNNEIVPCIMGE